MAQCLTDHNGLIGFIQKQRGGFEITAKIDDYVKAYSAYNSNLYQELLHTMEDVCMIRGIDGFHEFKILSFDEETISIENPQLEFAYSYVLYMSDPENYAGFLTTKIKIWAEEGIYFEPGDDPFRVIGIEEETDTNLRLWTEMELNVVYNRLISDKRLIADSFTQFRAFFDLTIEHPLTLMQWSMLTSTGEKYIKGLLLTIRYICMKTKHPLFEFGNKEICSRILNFFHVYDVKRAYHVKLLAQRYSEVKKQMHPSRESQSLFLIFEEVDNMMTN